MRILGVDYGSKRIGVAISDEEGQMAFPKIVLQNDSKIIDNFEKIIKELDIKKVVIGDSKNFKMIDNEIMTEIMDFKDILEKTFDMDVVLHSEMMSSIQAEKMQGKNKMLDASAAAIILQSYLDSKK